MKKTLAIASAALLAMSGVLAAPTTSGHGAQQPEKFSATERTLYNNAFENSEHLREYFQSLGFQVEVFNQLYLAPELTSMKRLQLPDTLLDELRPRLRLWMLKCR